MHNTDLDGIMLSWIITTKKKRKEKKERNYHSMTRTWAWTPFEIKLFPLIGFQIQHPEILQRKPHHVSIPKYFEGCENIFAGDESMTL